MTNSLLRETDQRIVIGAAATLEYVHVDATGEPAAPSTCTVGVTKADGTVVVSAGTATSAGTGTGVRTYSLAARTEPEQLKVTWTADSVGHVEYMDVVGGELWSVAYAASVDPSFASGQWSDATVKRGRTLAERECWDLTGRRFTPHYQRVRLSPRSDRSPTLVLPDWDIRSVREIVEVDTAGAVSYTWTAADLLTVVPSDAGVLLLRGSTWPVGVELIVGYEHGADRPPPPIIEATLRRARYWLSRPTSTLPDRATTFDAQSGGTYRLAFPDARSTGDLEVDAIYGRYRRQEIGVA